jgi:hypothetical protein
MNMKEVQVLSPAPGQQIQQRIEGPRRSKLTFAASEDCSAPIRLDRLRRVREPVSRSKTGVQGKVADVSSGRSRHAESQNELKAFQVLMATARSDAWQEQPLFLEYHHEGTKHRYTPDALVAWGEHWEVVEIKEDAEADLSENQTRFALIRELLAEHGLCFRVWKKSEICAEPRMANVARILRYRSVQVPAAENEGIRRTFSLTPQLPLRAFCENPMAVQHVLRLVLDGRLHIDWWEPLGLGSRISRSPIGRQVWPFPPAELQEAGCRCMH